MKWLGILAAVLVLAVITYRTAFPSATVRYRLTLEASVDGEPKVGSGVIEVGYTKNPQFLGESAELKISIRGEAVALDLGSRGTIFSLLRGDGDSRSNPERLVLRAFDFPGGGLPRPVAEGLTRVRQLSGKVELPFASLPLLVRFGDSKDLRTVEKIDPLDLGRSFGAGAKLVRVTLEIVPSGIWPFSWYGITGEPISTGIEKKLPWWNGPFPHLEPMGNGVFLDNRTEAFRVGKDDFKKGLAAMAISKDLFLASLAKDAAMTIALRTSLASIEVKSPRTKSLICRITAAPKTPGFHS
jgi:hypothetical protein